MNLNQPIDKLLNDLGACEEAIQFCKGKTWKEVYSTCYRGDWMLWLFKRTNPDMLLEITLAKGYCAKTIIHLMTDKRSRKAVNVAISFGKGKSTREQLAAAAYAAYAAADDADDADDAAYAAAAAADDAAYAAAAAAAYASYAAADDADDAAYAAAAAADDAVAAKTKNQLQTANICRKYLPINIWNIDN